MRVQRVGPPGLTRLVWVVAVLAFVACGDDERDSAAPDGDEDTVQQACDRLADLGQAILEVRDAPSRDAVRAGVEEPYRAFVAAAEATGDERLVEHAERAQERFEVYLTATDGLDAREAGNDADVALDRAGARCIELGATTELPEEPEG